MSKERELLKRALEELSSQDAALRQEFEGLLGAWGPLAIIEEIRNYLAEPEVKREHFSDDVVADSYFQVQPILGEYLKFKAGFRMAEKMHGIGDIDHGIGVDDE